MDRMYEFCASEQASLLDGEIPPVTGLQDLFLRFNRTLEKLLKILMIPWRSKAPQLGILITSLSANEGVPKKHEATSDQK